MNQQSLKMLFGTQHIAKLGSAIYMIFTSIYDIQEDITKIKKEHGLLIIGVFVLVKSIFELLVKLKKFPQVASN